MLVAPALASAASTAYWFRTVPPSVIVKSPSSPARGVPWLAGGGSSRTDCAQAVPRTHPASSTARRTREKRLGFMERSLFVLQDGDQPPGRLGPWGLRQRRLTCQPE